MDGTIIDTGESHYTSWKLVLKKHGADLERATFYQHFGQNNRACMTVYLGYEPTEKLYKEISEEKETLFRQVAKEKATLVPGVENWLRDIKNAGFSQVIASSAPMENILALFTQFELAPYFDDVISGFSLPAKPAPDVFLQAARAVNCPPDSCCVIEDAIAGVKAAKNAGMSCIAVSTSQDASNLTLADIIVKDFSEPVFEVLKSLP
jgi:HAD superfamily hydrolase (TIGR01509 family)